MKQRFITLVAAALATVSSAFAADFFSTGKCERLMGFGARIGVNTSNRTLGKNAFPECYHHESWGTGFDIGVVADLNIRDYLAIQPGFFFESRNGSYTLMGDAEGSGVGTPGVRMAQGGDRSSYNFTIPVMAVVRFNVADNVRWNVEAGPYVAFVLDSELKNKSFVTEGEGTYEPLFSQKGASVDFGFKMGTSLQLFGHYYVGAHYMAGCVPAWKEYDFNNITKKFGGCTKAWVFSIGYDF